MAVETESLLQTYYPSCIVNMRIRFDESLTASADTFPRLNKEELISKGAPSPQPYTGAPRLVEYGGATDATQLFARIPKAARVELPAYRSAGKWSLVFDYNDLPIDPRTVRSLGVSIYMDSVKATDFADAMGGTVAPSQGRQGAIQQRQRRLSMLNPTYENCVMQGVADSWQVSHSSSGSWVTIEGRDLRGCLLDSPILSTMLKDLPLAQDIGQVVQWIISKHEYGGQMAIRPAPAEEWPAGRIPSPFTSDGVTAITTRVLRGANGKKKTGGMVDAKPEVLNYWDVIVKYCNLVGAVPYFQAEILHIKPSRNLYDQQSAGTVRRLMFGRNVEELNIERKLAGRTPGQIEVVSLDTSTTDRGDQKLRVARWPADTAPTNLPANARNSAIAKDMAAALVSGVSPTDSAGKQDVVRISVPGITSLTRLTQIAQELYEEIGRGELGGSVKTRNLASFGKGNEDPDLVRLRPGDGIELQVDVRNFRVPGNIGGAPLSNDAGLSNAELVQRLTAKLGDENLARVIVASARNALTGLLQTYRVSNVSFSWDASSGISLEFDFHNFVVSRDAVTPTPVSQSNPRFGTVEVVAVPGFFGED